MEALQLGAARESRSNMWHLWVRRVAQLRRCAAPAKLSVLYAGSGMGHAISPDQPQPAKQSA
jgi:hypothetical protein